ncbi:MAG: SDR family oxidoreductase [Gammaproteobacteria bacterium]|jgi:NAD(P)-dependent dehydrogenase (short-subunit alcohol dehydrogenase family)|nr:SDR family oxidoreductase [Gammaproteobacteria bacterium]
MGDRLRLYGLNALVLNGGNGIGEAIARTLVKHGASVIAVDTRNSGVEQYFAEVKGITGMTANLVDADAMPALIQQAVDKMGGIDILVNEFPLSFEMPMSASAEKLEQLLKSRAALILSACRAALPHMKKSPAGRIINMGFLRSCFAADAQDACNRAEQDLANLTTALAIEIGEFGITANYVQPGGVMTPDSREVFRKNQALRDYCIKRSAARRIGEPVDVAKVALFLASDDAVFVSGTGIAVDGGRTGD